MPRADPTVHRPGLIPPLGRTAWVVLGMNTLSCFGSGLTKPFLVVYLHDVRDIELGTVGLLLGSIGLAGLLVMPLAGLLIDRVGPLRAFAFGQVVGGLGTALFVLATSPGTALVACLLLGVSGGITTNGLSTTLAVLVAPAHRGAAYGVGYTTLGIGIGLGALAAGFAVAAGSVRAYTVVFLLDGVAFLLFAAVLAVLARRVADRPAAQPGRPRAAGYSGVLTDRALLVAFALNTVFWAAALSQSAVAFPAWATGPAGQSTTVVGVAFAVNTAVLVLSQLPVIRWSRGRRRTGGVAAAGLLFAASWLLMTVAGAGGRVAAVVLVAALALFGLAEAVLAPTLPALVNDLAPADVRGRYNAVFNMSTQLGQILGPIGAGWLLAAGHGATLLVLLAGACLAVAACAAPARRVVPRPADLGLPT